MVPRVCVILFVALFGIVSAANPKENEKQGQCVDNILYAKYVCQDREDGEKILVPGKCSEYYECYKGESIKKSCSKFFDPETKKCVRTSTCVEVDNTDCVIPTPPPPPCAAPPAPPAPPKPPTPPSCNCPAPVPPSCPAPPACPPPTECPKPPSCPPPTECPAPPTCPGTPTEPPSKPPSQPPCSPPSGGPCGNWFNPDDLYGSFVCQNKPDGLKLVVPTSCSDYYYCIGGHSYRKSCGSNLYFNPQVNACDLKNNTKCPADNQIM